MTDPTLWNQFLFWPILNLLVGLYRIFESLHIPGPLGWAIISLTIISRIVLFPVMKAQMTSAKKMAKLKPEIDALNEKHKNDKQQLQQAQLALYKEHGVNPAGGCIPLLIQFPLVIALYNVFSQVLSAPNIGDIVQTINHVVYHPMLHLTTIDTSFLGINLTSKPSLWQSSGIWLLLVPVVTAVLQWFQTQQMYKAMSPPTKAIKPKQKDNKKEPTQEDTMADLQKQMALISPIMFGFISYQLPLGLALYWNVSGIFGMIQQARSK